MCIGWINASHQIGLENSMTLCKLVTGGEMKLNLTLDCDLSWKLKIFGNHISVDTCPLLQELPQVLSSLAKVNAVVKCLDSANMCIGNRDPNFLTLASNRKGVFKNASGSYIINGFCYDDCYFMF
jgi:hypothetical protein